MTDPTPDRRAELIAAALSRSLTGPEQREFEKLRAGDPTVDIELDHLRTLVGRMSGALPIWDDSAPSPALRDRVVGIADAHGAVDDAHASTDQHEPLPVTRRGRWVTGVAAAACIALGVGMGVAATTAIGSIETAPPPGRPGDLGVVEEVGFVSASNDVDVDGAVVAHTWGTETLLEIDGLPTGDTFSVMVVTGSGARLPAGTFLGSEATVDCQMNAAVLREKATGIEIMDADGVVVSAAELPSVD
ncbi:MAG: hypothetical protein RI885_2364 [Actinomycetota bacterium]|jgi:hypothetical protein